jgi:hypothetical protein
VVVNVDHLDVRLDNRLRLGVLAVGLAAPIGLFVVSSAWGSQASTVPLRLKVTGSGTVSVTGKRAVTCRTSSCSHTFRVPRRRRIVVKASPLAGWKLTKWAGACRGSAETCSLRLKGRRSAAVAFAPPGSHSNPYPLGTSVTLTGPTGNWQVKVDSVIMNANAQVEAVIDPVLKTRPNRQPAAGWQYTLINFTMTFEGSGSVAPSSIIDAPAEMWAEGKGYTIYPPDDCEPPPPDLASAARLSSGQSSTGNLCYEIHSSDVGSLLLSGQARSGKKRKTVWFALR